jgi:O-antigen/teichoic acid export membrane protein
VNLRRRASLNVVDQAVVALANAANPILAAALLDKHATGVMLLALAYAYAANGLGRAFVGEVILAHAPRLDDAHRRQLVRDGAATAALFGLAAGVVLLAIWASGIDPDLADLVWVAPAIPVILLQDTGRHAALAAGAPARALAVDAGWILTQSAIIVVLAVTGLVSGGSLLAAWGAGAAVPAAAWLIRDRVNPLRGRPRRWLAEVRHLSGWFTATAVVGQTHTLVIAQSVVKLLDPASYALLRLAQVAVLQPIQNLITAMNSLLVPRASRLAGAGDAAAIRQQTLRASAALGAFGLVVIVVASLAARPVLARLLPAYVDAATLALPISIQSTIYLVQVPFTAGLRGMQRPRSLLVQYVIFAVASLAAFVAGVRFGGLIWGVWGLTAGSAFGLVVMVVAWRAAVRAVRPAPAPVP